MKFPIRYPDMELGHRSEGYRIYPRLLDIERETISILQGVPIEQAVNIALASSQEMPLINPPKAGENNTHIPAVAVFSRDGETPQDIWKKLLTVLRTPDYGTPSYDHDVRPLIDALKSTLFRSGYVDGPIGAIASLHIIRVAGGDPAAINWVYRDMARRYPQYSDEWYDTLERQFEGNLFPNKFGSQTEQELYQTLLRNVEIATRHERLHNKKLQGEDLSQFVTRQLSEAREVFSISNEEDLARTASILDRVWEPYRRETYTLRNIPYDY